MEHSINDPPSELVRLDVRHPIWDQFFLVAPLVVIGSREASGEIDFAPKHMATPMGWENYFGFVCTPEHSTYQNIVRETTFTVSFPRPDSVVLASLAASPRCDDDTKPALSALPSFSAESVEGHFLRDSSLFFECELDRIVDGFGINSLIVGTIVSAHADPRILRGMDVDDQDVITASPLMAYLAPGRYATIDHTNAFPFPVGFQRHKDVDS